MASSLQLNVRPAEPFRWHLLAFVICLGCSCFLSYLLHVTTDRTQLGWTPILFGVWLGFSATIAWSTRDKRLSVPFILFAALILRAPLIGTPPLLSDDVYRYLWEGLAMNSGYNPFLHSPSSIEGLDNGLQSLVNHPDIPSVYPPLTLWWFRLLDALGGTVVLAQTMVAAFDLLIVWSMTFFLRSQKRPLGPALFYSALPLPVVESAAGAHLDVIGVSFTVLAIALIVRKRPHTGYVLLIAGAAIKLFPALIVPAVLQKHHAVSHWLTLFIACVGGLLIAWPVVSWALAFFQGWSMYARHWEFNGLLFPVLKPIMGSNTRLFLMGLAAVPLIAAAVKKVDPLTFWFVAGATFMMTSPTMHPWYGLWLLVPATLLGRWGWALAACWLLSSYAVLLGFSPESGEWSVPWWLWFTVWCPALLSIAAETGHKRLTRRVL